MAEVWYQKWIDKVQSRKDNPFTLKEYVEMCIDLEAHETDTHNKYAAAAKRRQK